MKVKALLARLILKEEKAENAPPVPKADPEKLIAEVLELHPHLTRSQAIQALKTFGEFVPAGLKGN